MVNSENEKRLYASSGEYKFDFDDFNEIAKSRMFEDISEGMKKYMPIGSVVEVEDIEKTVMVVGFNYEEDEVIYDYIGCSYPFGISRDSLPVLFNHEQIEKVYHVGFIDVQEKVFKNELRSCMKR